MTPTFSRIWLVKTQVVLDLARMAVSLRRAWLISRACMPMVAMPISPSSSALGTSAADRINHDHVQRVGAGQRFANAQGFLAAVRLGDQQFVQVDAQFFGVGRVERVLGVDERRQAAGLLGVGDDVEHQGGFAGGFRPENLHHPPARHAADAQRQVHRQRAGGNDFDALFGTGVAQAHDAAIAVGLGDGGNGGFQIALRGRRRFLIRRLSDLSVPWFRRQRFFRLLAA